MNEMQVFDNNEFGKIRIILINNVIWFIGRDIATILGYKNANAAIAKHVDTEDKGIANCDTLGGSQKLIVINESGLYSLILSSKLPAAKKFKRWVTSELLPSIRRTGMYAAYDYLQTPDFLMQVARELKFNKMYIRELEDTVDELEDTIDELTPKTEQCSVTFMTDDLKSVSLIAKDYGKSGIWLNKYLCDKKVQCKIDQTYVLNDKYAGKGYIGTKTYTVYSEDCLYHSKTQTYWTEKGRKFIYELLKSDGIFPVSEQYWEGCDG